MRTPHLLAARMVRELQTQLSAAVSVEFVFGSEGAGQREDHRFPWHSKSRTGDGGAGEEFFPASEADALDCRALALGSLIQMSGARGATRPTSPVTAAW